VVVEFLPLVLALVLLVGVHLGRVSEGIDRLLTRTSMVVFDRFTVSQARRNRRKNDLWAAHVPVTYREYAVRTRLVSYAQGVVGGVVGIYLAWAVFALLLPPGVGPAEALAARGIALNSGIDIPLSLQVFVYGTALALVFGLGTALVTYGYRWYYPQFVADERERQIDMSLPMTVSFMYALSRSGMSFTEVMRILARNGRVYGEAADEVRVAVRNVDVFGVDVVTAVETMGRRSPSRRFRELSENLTSVLRTGGSLAEFLERQYREFRQEAEVQQERLLTSLATFAEAYAAIGIALPLFGMVVLLILAIGPIGDLPLLMARGLVYVFIPLFNLGFVLYLSGVVDDFSLQNPSEGDLSINVRPKGVRRRDDLATEQTPPSTDGRPTPDGGVASDALSSHDRDRRRVAANQQRLAVYRQLREVRERLGSPVRTVLQRPTALLWVSVPLAILLLGLRIPAQLGDRVLTIREFDDLLIQSLLLVVGSFALVYEIHRRRIEAVEAVVPDFLDRLASLNEAGMTVVASMNRIRRSELGRLNDELDVIWRDVQWGADMGTALKRFEARMRTRTISRAVTLITESMRASGDIGPVLRIAANRAKADRRLKQRRRDEMVVYNIFIYIGFLVFLAIVAVVTVVLLPNLPDTTALTEEQARSVAFGGSSLQGIGQIDQDAWRLTLAHGIIVQGFFSGWLAGQFSAGDLRAGAKHVTILVALGYLTTVLVL